jgi:RNA polymerase sigma-70 factor (ECF subfamily)
MDDVAAIRSCTAGNRDAFRFLVERYQAEAIGHATAILGRREDAQDAVQEAFLDAYRALGRFDCARRFYPWFYAILRNRCYKLMVERSREEAGFEAGDLLDRPAGVSVEESLALERALLKLDPEDRELVTLRHLDGLCYAELAERLRIPLGTVMSRLFYARRRLRRRLAGSEGGRSCAERAAKKFA